MGDEDDGDEALAADELEDKDNKGDREAGEKLDGKYNNGVQNRIGDDEQDGKSTVAESAQLGIHELPLGSPLLPLGTSSARQERRLRLHSIVPLSSTYLHSPISASRQAHSPTMQSPGNSIQTGSGRSPGSGEKQQRKQSDKTKQRRKYKRLNRLRLKQQQKSLDGRNGLLKESSPPTSSVNTPVSSTRNSSSVDASAAPQLHDFYVGRVRENERSLELSPKLRVLNQVEVCNIELLVASSANGEQPPPQAKVESQFVVSWIDRVNGEATLEAKSEELMNCERQRNHTFLMRAIGCNGLHSNE